MKNKNSKKLSFENILDNNRFLMVISFVIALGLWVWVAIDKSPEIQTVITNVPVKINLENSVPQQLGLQIFGKSEFTVDVTVTGKKYILSNLKAEDIQVEANTNYVDSAGTKTLQLKVAPADSSEEFTISSVSSTYIEVFFDTYKEIEFSISGDVATTLETIIPDGCMMGDIVFSKNAVTVSGPTTEINRIIGVHATANVNEVLEKTTTFDPDVKLVTSDGSKLEYSKMAVDESEITMTIPVLKVVTLPTTVEFKNAPSYFIDNPLSYTVYPSTVKVAVPVDMIDATKHFVVDTIDFADIANSYNTFNVDAESISSFKIVDESIKRFRVRVNASGFESKTITVPASKITLKDNRNDFKVVLNGNKDIAVTVIGSPASLEKITADNITIQVDTTDKSLTKDTSTITAKVVVNSESGCWAFGKYDIKVKVTPNH